MAYLAYHGVATPISDGQRSILSVYLNVRFTGRSRCTGVEVKCEGPGEFRSANRAFGTSRLVPGHDDWLGISIWYMAIGTLEKSRPVVMDLPNRGVHQVEFTSKPASRT